MTFFLDMMCMQKPKIAETVFCALNLSHTPSDFYKNDYEKDEEKLWFILNLDENDVFSIII